LFKEIDKAGGYKYGVDVASQLTIAAAQSDMNAADVLTLFKEIDKAEAHKYGFVVPSRLTIAQTVAMVRPATNLQVEDEVLNKNP